MALEFSIWPPHCLKGTPGADLLPEACVSRRLVIPNELLTPIQRTTSTRSRPSVYIVDRAPFSV